MEMAKPRLVDDVRSFGYTEMVDKTRRWDVP